jgi:hypothetical protein
MTSSNKPSSNSKESKQDKSGTKSTPSPIPSNQNQSNAIPPTSATPQSGRPNSAGTNNNNNNNNGNLSVPAVMNKPNALKGAARYEVSPGILGKGHFAVVKKCRDVLTGQVYAVKILDKKELVKSAASVVKQEIEILRAVGAHPNIVQLIDHFEDNHKHFLVMELCLGREIRIISAGIGKI